MNRISVAVGVLIAVLAVATPGVTVAAQGAGPPIYLDADASIHLRVSDLLGRMTLEEKAGQMDRSTSGSCATPRSRPTGTATTPAPTTTRCRRHVSSAS
jgi:hypothetical protein